MNFKAFWGNLCQLRGIWVIWGDFEAFWQNFGAFWWNLVHLSGILGNSKAFW